MKKGEALALSLEIRYSRAHGATLCVRNGWIVGNCIEVNLIVLFTFIFKR